MTEFHKLEAYISGQKLEPTRGTCFVASRLEFAAVAVLLRPVLEGLAAVRFKSAPPPPPFEHTPTYVGVSGNLASLACLLPGSN